MPRTRSTTSATRPASSVSLPISRKAYERFVARIKDVYSGYILDPTPMLEALDDYLAGNKGVHFRLPALAHLAFLMLRHDIDAAIERSRAARERARLRRKAKMQETATDGQQPSAHTASPPDATTVTSPPSDSPAVTSPRPKKRIKCHNRHAQRVSPRIFMQLDNVPTPHRIHSQDGS